VFCANVLEEGGFKVGLYTSPHLKDFEERIQINQEPISQVELVKLVKHIKPVVQSIDKITTFEIMTGLAFLYFAQKNIDIAVIEVGLGGRLDATNIIRPLVSVITSLYLDHTSILGDTIEEIAAEKGGIIKSEIPVVCAPQEPNALKVIQNIAKEKDSPLIIVERDYPYEIIAQSLDGQEFVINDQNTTKSLENITYSIPLLGDYQVMNAVTAFAALKVIQDLGFALHESDFQQGLSGTTWPARFEIISKYPPIIIDSAHNPASIIKLRKTIDVFFPEHPMILIFGISEDKHLEDMLEGIMPRVTHLICTQADHPRALNPTILAEKAKRYSCSIEVIPRIRDAFAKALSWQEDNDLILVAGSIFVAASARIAWFEDLAMGKNAG
jgi:dihydrofolate synthase/folylpolyglutamate synthase